MIGVRHQSGVTLVIVLIIVGVVLVANLALMRSMSTVNRVASNKSFKQAATQAGLIMKQGVSKHSGAWLT